MARRRTRSRRASDQSAWLVLEGGGRGGAADASLLDIVDNVLRHGVVLQGDIILGIANIDSIYARLSLLLSTIDRVAPTPIRPVDKPPPGGRRTRR